MQVECFAEIKAGHGEPSRRPMVIFTIDRAEAMRLISKLSAGLEASRVTRYGVEWQTPPNACLPVIVDGNFLADVYFNIDITKGYLNGDNLKEEDKK